MTDGSNDKPKTPLTGRDLSKLYPAAKTYDEIEERQAQVDAAKLKRRPKFTLVSVSVVIALILSVLLDVDGLTSSVTDLMGGMSGTFTLFLIGSAMFGVLLWQLRRALHFFASRGLYGAWFVWLYIFTAFAVAWTYTTYSADDQWLSRMAFGGAHAVFMLVSAAVYIRLARNS